MSLPRRAVVREIADTLKDALVREPPPEPIDVGRARTQHAAYVEALRRLGLEVEVIPNPDQYPDGCFVEDCAVVADGHALIPHLGAPSRREEPRAIADALARHGLELMRMTLGGTLDGGDCLRIGRRFWVGLSKRTNPAGLEEMRGLFGPLGLEVIGVPIEGALHLKSLCSRLDDETVLIADGALPDGLFEGLRVVRAPRAEAYAANVVALGRAVLVAAGHPRTFEAVARAGFEPVAIDNSELRKADGALTCLSILF